MPTDSLYIPVAGTQSYIDRVNADNRRAQGIRQQMTFDFARTLEAFQRAYPTSTAQTKLALAQAGLGPDDPRAQELLRREAEVHADRHAGADGWLATIRNAAGTAIGAVADIADTALGPIDEAAGPVFRGTVRGAFSIFDMLEQELLFRPIRAIAGTFTGMDPDEAWRQAGSSALNVSLKERGYAGTFLSESEQALGSGFIPRGAASQAADRMQKRIQVAGAPADPGYLAATGVGAALDFAIPGDVKLFEPGTQSHAVFGELGNLAAAVALDPAAGVLSTTSKVRKASKFLGGEPTKLFYGLGEVGRRVDPATGALKLKFARRGGLDAARSRQVGLVGGGTARRSVLGENVDAWLRSEDGQNVVRWARETDDFRTIWKGTGEHMDPRRAYSISQAQSDPEVVRHLSEFIQKDLGGSVPHVQKVRDPKRFWSLMPGDSMPIDNSRDALREWDRTLINADVGPDDHARLMDQMAQATRPDGTMDPTGMFLAAEEGMTTIKARLVRDGVDPEVADGATRMWDRFNEMRKYLVDTMGDDTAAQHFNSVVANAGQAEKVDLMSVSEALGKQIPLPNARHLRELTASPIFQKAGKERLWKQAGALGLAANDMFMRAWIPLTLIRGAWMLRVVGEEQVRMAVAGMDSVFRHPASWLSWVASEDGNYLQRAAQKIARREKGQGDVLGVDFDDLDVQARVKTALSPQIEGWGMTPAGFRKTGLFDEVYQGQEGYRSGWAFELRKLNRDPLARKVAGLQSQGARNADEVAKDWFFNGDGRRYWDEAARMLKLDDQARHSREVADSYVDWMKAVVDERTGRDGDLLSLIATGRLDDINMASRAAKSQLTERLQQFEGVGPERVAKEVLRRDADLNLMERVTDTLFDAFMTVPTNTFSRLPVFKQRYWRHVRDTFGAMTDDVQQHVLAEAARQLGEGSKEYRALEVLRRQGVGDLIGTAEEADLVAKAHALDHVRTLLYDQARRSQWVDMTRGAFVFAEAWKEVGTRWLAPGGLLAQGPQVIRRVQQGVQGLEDVPVYEVEDGYQGVLYPDPETGEEMFMYPGGGLLSKALGIQGPAEVGFSGRVAGLNIFSQSFLPGFGPVAQMALGKVIPEMPDTKWLRDVVFPFGEMDADDPTSIAATLMPSWLRKMFTETQDPRLFANTTFDIAKALHLSGEYPTDTEADVERLLADAKKKAKWLYRARAGLQFMAPSAPSVEFRTEDKNGDWFTFQVLQEEYYNLFQQVGGDHFTAAKAFGERFGFEPHLLRQGKSKSLNQRAVTKIGAEWEREHPELVDQHRAVIGYFAPQPGDDQSPEAQLDYQAYVDSIDTGDRQALTPKQMTYLASAMKGEAMYAHLTDLIDRSTLEGREREEALRYARNQVKITYPGFRTAIVGLPEGRPRDELIGKLEVAVADPTLAETDAGQALRIYLSMRRMVKDRVKSELGLSTFSSDRTVPYRKALEQLGGALTKRHADFLPVWEQVLASEVKVEDEKVLA